jgi:hypothetical protein
LVKKKVYRKKNEEEDKSIFITEQPIFTN